MEPFVYVMAIMGCADGGTMCQEVRLVETRYVSQLACQQDASAQLEANSDVSAPTILAQCRRATALYASR